MSPGVYVQEIVGYVARSSSLSSGLERKMEGVISPSNCSSELCGGIFCIDSFLKILFYMEYG